MFDPEAKVPVSKALQRLICTCLLFASGLGCTTLPKNDVADAIMPSNFRDWSPEFAVLPSAEIDGDLVTVRNVRNISYLDEENYVLDFEDRTYDLSEIETIDFFVVPFAGIPMMAHTMVSFGFGDEDYLTISAEIRTEKGEKYSPVLGVSRQYEITYVAADERDIVRLRTRYRNADVYLYRTNATPEMSRQLFLSMMDRVNQLAQQPEFYDTIRNNCTTNIVRHVNEIAPKRVPYSLGVLLPGYADRYAYDLGLLDNSVSFKELKKRAWINDLADRHFAEPDFSKRIRMRADREGEATTSFGVETLEVLESPLESIGEPIDPSQLTPTPSSPSPGEPTEEIDGQEGDGWIRRTGLEQPSETPDARVRNTPAIFLTPEPREKRSLIPSRRGPQEASTVAPTQRPTPAAPVASNSSERPNTARRAVPSRERPPKRPGWFDFNRWSRRSSR